jgi:alpha-ketoglutarate-dependent taurine dioxygenase
MLTQAVTDARAWRASTMGARESWYHSLSQRCLTDELQPARAALESGCGFVVLRGAMAECSSPAEMQARYWHIGGLLGQPVEQNVQGALLYDVRDTGQDVRYGARFSVTNAESSFHTDNSFGPTIVDYVGLLCLQTAKQGGLSQVVSGYSVHNELLAHHPDVLEVLYQPVHFECRGGVRPGEAPTVQYPVLAWDGCDLTYRYLRYWIESGHERISQPLTAAQQRALDVLDGVLANPDLRVEFDLRPGDLFFVNNRWILHNRTAFEDHTEPGQRRHLVRLWLRR